MDSSSCWPLCGTASKLGAGLCSPEAVVALDLLVLGEGCALGRRHVRVQADAALCGVRVLPHRRFGWVPAARLVILLVQLLDEVAGCFFPVVVVLAAAADLASKLGVLRRGSVDLSWASPRRPASAAASLSDMRVLSTRIRID